MNAVVAALAVGMLLGCLLPVSKDEVAPVGVIPGSVRVFTPCPGASLLNLTPPDPDGMVRLRLHCPAAEAAS